MAAETVHFIASSFDICFQRDYAGEAADLRRLFRRERHTQVVTNVRRVGLLSARAAGLPRGLGIDPELADAA